MNVSVLYSLIEYLDKVLPINSSKTYKKSEKAEIISFIKLFLALDGQLSKIGDDIIVDKKFKKIIMILFFGYVIVPIDSLKMKMRTLDDVFMISARASVLGDIKRKEFFPKYKESFAGAWSNDNPYSRKKQKPKKRR